MVPMRKTLIFLASITAVAVFFCYLLVAPFLKAIVFAAVVAIIFHPLHARLHRWIRNRDIAAAISTAALAVVIASASVFLGTSIVSGLTNLYRSLTNPASAASQITLFVSDAIEKFVAMVSGYVPVTAADLHAALAGQTEKAISSTLAVTARTVGGLTSLIVNALISLFILYFLFRDGSSLLRRLAVWLPMDRKKVNRLYETVRQTLNAIVYGTLAIAAIQGALTAIAFWILGVGSPVLWGTVTALCGLLPVIGTGFVLAPAVVMLAVSGHWTKSLILLTWAIAAVHPVDNLLRPYLIGEKTQLSTLYVFFALMGGFEAFGALGLFVGPLILSITIALFTFLREELKSLKPGEHPNLRPMIQPAPKRAAP